MTLKFQYNKISQLNMRKQLKIRENALPTLKNKESALRFEVKKARDAAHAMDLEIEARGARLEEFLKLWVEFDPSLIKISEVKIRSRKIAGVKTPELEGIEYQLSEYDLFTAPSWWLDGVSTLKELSRMQIEREFMVRKMQLLEVVRKKTTQKVNLYEKVQIPAYEEAILKITRFMEDEENLSKAAQKILKGRMAAEANA
ncbi:MAG TPA: V-type ATP synthase subunit D [Candidatus Cloacimonadota bacterium]|nr:V-type ATP synthase subunit D [Candidatus Cloacimonadota bacterium]HOH78171.1 V-type ATP synthase subunit D [Candidatus Cloacimonadota bacterium]